MQDYITKIFPALEPIAMNIGKFITALLIFFIGWLISKWAKRLVRSGLSRVDNDGIDATVKPLLVKLASASILIIAILIALSHVGVPITSLVAVLAAAGLAIGLALQGTLSNIAAGVMLLVLRPIRVNEFIETPNVSGKVLDLGLFTTSLKTADGLYVCMPNAQLWGNRIQNLDRFPVRRANIDIGVAYDSDLDKVTEIILKTVNEHPNVLSEPAIPEALVETFADSSINILIRFWLPKTNWRPDASAIRIAIKKAFDANNIEIPFPQRVIHKLD